MTEAFPPLQALAMLLASPVCLENLDTSPAPVDPPSLRRVDGADRLALTLYPGDVCCLFSAPFEDLPCAALHADAHLCRQHPRCMVQYEKDDQQILQRCLLDDAYLSLAVSTPDFCTAAPADDISFSGSPAEDVSREPTLPPMAAVTEGEIEAVALDLLQELGVDGPSMLEQMAKDGRTTSEGLCGLVQVRSL